MKQEKTGSWQAISIVLAVIGFCGALVQFHIFFIIFLTIYLLLILLAEKFPRVFGFLLGEFGIKYNPEEPKSHYHAKRGAFWIECALIATVINFAIYRTVDTTNHIDLEAIVVVLGPILIAWAYLYGLIAFVVSYFHWRSERKKEKQLNCVTFHGL